MTVIMITLLTILFNLIVFLLLYYCYQFLVSPSGRVWVRETYNKVWNRGRLSARERSQFDGHLPDALQTIASSLRAGLTLKDSLGIVAQNETGILVREVQFALKEYHFGVAMEEALHGIRQRVHTSSCNLAFGAMIMSLEVGGDLPTMLHNIVGTIKERQRVEGRLKALTAQGRAQAVLLCLAPPFLALGMYLYDESKMALLTSGAIGQCLLVLAVVLEVIGIFVTSRVMKLEI